MRRKKYKKIFILLLPLWIILAYSSSFFPKKVEKYYSEGIYRFIGQILSSITGFVPFSLAEAIVISLCLFLLFYIIKTIIKAFKAKNGLKILIDFISNVLMVSSIIYLAFLLLWGLNYHREPFSSIIGLDIKPASVKDLSLVCEDLINRANELRSKVDEDNNGCMYIKGGFISISSRANSGFKNASKILSQLGGNFGPPKGVFLSVAMCYAGITGVYFPFTGEANVNIMQPYSMLPSTVCHEMAHQRGFAREDEANYISYLVCSLHPDTDFQYSGVLLALINSMNALYSHDPHMYKMLSLKYSPGLKRDLIQNDEFWKHYEGPIERISNNINDTYLKANMQKDGVYSYGRMVDLIIAEYRKKGKLE